MRRSDRQVARDEPARLPGVAEFAHVAAASRAVDDRVVHDHGLHVVRSDVRLRTNRDRGRSERVAVDRRDAPLGGVRQRQQLRERDEVLDRVVLARGDLDVDAVGVEQRSVVDHGTLGSRLREPHRLRCRVRAGEHAALLVVGDRSRVLRVQSDVVVRERHAEIRRDVVVLERCTRRRPDQGSDESGRFLVDAVRGSSGYCRPRKKVVRTRNVEIVEHGSQIDVRTLAAVCRDRRHAVRLLRVRSRSRLHIAAAGVCAKCRRVDLLPGVVPLDLERVRSYAEDCIEVVVNRVRVGERQLADEDDFAVRESVIGHRGEGAWTADGDRRDVERPATVRGSADWRRRVDRRIEADARKSPIRRAVPTQLARGIGRMDERDDVAALHVVDVEQVGRSVWVRDLENPRRHRVPVGRVRRRVARGGRDAVVVHATARDEVADVICGRAVVGGRRSRPDSRSLRVEPEVPGSHLHDQRLGRAELERDQAGRGRAVLHLAHEREAGTVLHRTLRERDEVEHRRRARLVLGVVDAPEHLRADLAACERAIVRPGAWHRSAS